MLNVSDDHIILGVTFESKMTFEKQLRSVSRAASQRLGILRKSWQVFHDRLLLGRCFPGFVLPVLEYCSAVMCSAADTRLQLLDRAVSGARFLTEGVFECDIAHRRSVSVLYMMYKIRCNPMHPLNNALPGPYVQCGLHAVPRSHIGVLMCRLAAEPAKPFFSLSVHLWNDLADPVFDGVGLAGFKSRARLLYWPKLIYPYYSLLLFFPFSSFCP